MVGIRVMTWFSTSETLLLVLVESGVSWILYRFSVVVSCSEEFPCVDLKRHQHPSHHSFLSHSFVGRPSYVLQVYFSTGTSSLSHFWLSYPRYSTHVVTSLGLFTPSQSFFQSSCQPPPCLRAHLHPTLLLHSAENLGPSPYRGIREWDETWDYT